MCFSTTFKDNNNLIINNTYIYIIYIYVHTYILTILRFYHIHTYIYKYIACSFNYIGNMVFRIGHNFVLGCLSPRQRVYFALGAIGTAMSIITFLVIIFQYHWIGFIYMAYFLGGCGIGTISPNLLSCITPLGHDTKVWAISGMPVGFNLISIGGFAA